MRRSQSRQHIGPRQAARPATNSERVTRRLGRWFQESAQLRADDLHNPTDRDYRPLVRPLRQPVLRRRLFVDRRILSHGLWHPALDATFFDWRRSILNVVDRDALSPLSNVPLRNVPAH